MKRTNEQKKEYNRKWNAENPEKAREFSRKWRTANSARVKESKRKWRAENPEKIKESKRKWARENPEKIKAANKKWAKENPEKMRAAARKWAVANPEKVKAAVRKWNAANPEKISEIRIKWRAENPERVSEQNKKDLKTFREKKRGDPIYKMHQNMRSSMSHALRGRHKSVSTMKIIGCTVEGLFEHLESCASWKPWMTRENYGAGGWDVDHIIPIAQWDDDCPLQFALCWNKSNLQPLEHIENIKKGAR